MNEVGSGSGGMAQTGDTEGDEGLETDSGVKRSTEHVKKRKKTVGASGKGKSKKSREKRKKNMKNVQHFFVKSQGSTKQETSTGYYVTFVRSGTTGMRGDIKRTKGFLQRVVQIQSCRHFVYKIKLRNV